MCQKSAASMGENCFPSTWKNAPRRTKKERRRSKQGQVQGGAVRGKETRLANYGVMWCRFPPFRFFPCFVVRSWRSVWCA